MCVFKKNVGGFSIMPNGMTIQHAISQCLTNIKTNLSMEEISYNKSAIQFSKEIDKTILNEIFTKDENFEQSIIDNIPNKITITFIQINNITYFFYEF